jgi:hypothetical protein
MIPAWRVLAVGAAGLAATGGPAIAAPADPGGPLPLLEAAPGNRGAAGDAVAGARLVLTGASEPRRLELARALESLAAGWQRRRNPLFVPLGDDDAAALDKLLAAWLPATTAALALTAGRWQSSDGDLAVRPVARCAPGGRCARLAVGLSRNTFDRRLRYLAWPVGYATVVRAPSDGEAARVAERLRAEDRQDSRIALVLTAADIHAPGSSPGFQAVTRAAARMAAALRRRREPAIELVAAFARAGAARDDLPWLTLPAGAIVVVPRLGSLAQPAEFVGEVRSRLAAAGGKLEWLAAPAPP